MISYLTYLSITLLASLLTGSLAYKMLEQTSPERRMFSMLLGSVALWCLGAFSLTLVALAGGSLEDQLFWAKFQYVGPVFAPILWFCFICTYTGVKHIRVWPFLVVPTLSLVTLWTNEQHHLFWEATRLEAFKGSEALRVAYGPWFDFVHVPYTYTLVAVSFALLIRALIGAQRGIRVQLMLLLSALSLPAISNLGFLIGRSGTLLDPTPPSFAVSALLVSFALYRFQLFRQKPVAYRTIFEHLQDAVLILDKSYGIVDANPKAQRMLEQSLDKLLGRDVEQFIRLPNSAWADMEISQTRAEEPYGDGYIDLYLNPIQTDEGYVLSVHDVSKRRQAEVKLELQLDKLNALVATGEALRRLRSSRDVYEEALKVVFDKTKTSSCRLLLLDGERLKIVASGHKGQILDGPGGYIAPGEGLCWQVIEVGQTVHLRNANGLADTRSEDGVPVDYIGVPVRSESGSISGALIATLNDASERFDESDRAFLEAVAQACGSALSRFQRLAEAHATAKEYRELYTAAQRQTRELALLDRVRNAVTREVNLSEVIQATVEAVNEEFDHALVSLYSLQGGELVLQHQRGYEALPEVLPLSRGVIGRVARTGQAILVSEPSSFPGFIGTVEDILSEVAVPIFDHDEVVGVLNLETAKGAKLDQADLKLMMALSEQISLAVGRARLYEEIQESEQRFRLLAENMSDLICLHDLRGRYTYVSPSSEALLGYTPEYFLGQWPGELIHPDDVEDLFKPMLRLLMAGQSVKPLSYRVRRASGEYIWLETSVQPVRDETGQLTHFISGSRDITERKKMQEQLLEGALLYDALTKLPNRVLFADRLRQAIKRSEREAKPFSLLFLDLDRFKIVNDSLGHSVGDELLTETAMRLQACVRAQDTVARLGGDEFAVILEGTTAQRAEEVASCIQKALSEPYRLGGHSVSTSASIGITLGNSFERNLDPEQLLRNADLAMYHAKASGKAQHALFDDGMHQRIQDLMQLEQDLRRALEEEQFFVVYQPVVDLNERSLMGFEALVRWRHPERGIIEPSRFIPIAEEMGLIASIDHWVLKEASRQVHEWGQRFSSKRPLTLSVNLSTKNFLLDTLVSSIKEVLTTTGLAPSQLKLEITESVLMDNVEVGTAFLNELRAYGVGMQIDDFGTGYSSLSYLHTLPLDSLKIDRSFVQKLSGSEDSAIVRTIVALAQSLGLDIVAEGIETPNQFELLSQLGCHYGQGYYMAKPLPSHEVEKLFVKSTSLTLSPTVPTTLTTLEVGKLAPRH